jgi:LuxR family quorum-sensing system transcriptional regulator SinR
MVIKSLTRRETEVLLWAARGKTYAETATILSVAYSTIHSQMNSIKLKLDAVNVTHAVARGYEIGVLGLHTAEPMRPLA